MTDGLGKSFQHVFFVGIGGISMSGLAEILIARGLDVSGSDIKKSTTTEHLEGLGTKIYIGHDKENITDTLDLVVYTAAVKMDNPELVAAKEKGIPLMGRAQLLGHIMHDYAHSVGVSGTHGKTTTTSMISEILLQADKDPTISVGAILPSIHGNTKVGQSEFFVAEACEYFDSFLQFHPFIAVILNIEADHLDYFKDLAHIQASFHKYASNVPANGTLVINDEIHNLDFIIKDLQCQVMKFSVTDTSAHWYAKDITHNEDGTPSFTAVFMQKELGRIQLFVPGMHNVKNALAACAASYVAGADIQTIIQALASYRGANRRFQPKGSFQGVSVYDDYAHHPTEIKATLSAMRNVKHNQLWCVFQPHTYTRTYTLFDDFSNAFFDADHIVIADIYAAREKDTGLVSAKVLAEKIRSLGKDAVFIGNFNEIHDYLTQNCQAGDVLITMGAGDVYLIGESVVSN